mmetsp:Transcript_9750/g.23832  ORF Transcript_9750/g.23832 Transcript_9750/m.23832 type:complete len:234 (+) Transcript_9750:417-1118(+)
MLPRSVFVAEFAPRASSRRKSLLKNPIHPTRRRLEVSVVVFFFFLRVQILDHQNRLRAQIALLQRFAVVAVFVFFPAVDSFREVGRQGHPLHDRFVALLRGRRRRLAVNPGELVGELQDQKGLERPDRFVGSEATVELLSVREPKPDPGAAGRPLGGLVAEQFPRPVEAVAFFPDLSLFRLSSFRFLSFGFETRLVALSFPLLVLSQCLLVFLVLLAAQQGGLFLFVLPCSRL